MPMKALKTESLPIILFILIISGCVFTNTYTNRQQDKKDGEKITDNFFKYLKNKDYKSIYPLFSDKFYEASPKDSLDRIFEISQNQLGDVISTDLNDWTTKVVTGTENSAEY